MGIHPPVAGVRLFVYSFSRPFFWHASGSLVALYKPAGRQSGKAYATLKGIRLAALMAGFLGTGRQTKPSSGSCKKITMKTDKNSRTQSTTSGALSHPELAIPDSILALIPPPPKHARISYEKWLVKYRPIQNHLDKTAPYGRRLFGIRGKDLKFVRTQPYSKIWTLVEQDGKIVIRENFRWVNRLGYFITEVAAPQDRYFSIKAD